ncbi:MAG: sulfotransferase domain-containing protein [Pseudomonadota bacterium]
MSRINDLVRKNRGLLRDPAAWGHAARAAGLRARNIAGPPQDLVIAPSRLLAGQHKAMTTYFSAVLQTICFAYNLSFQKVIRGYPETRTDVVLHFTSNFQDEPRASGEYLLVKILRDPRDVVLSGYHYHLWSDESWVNTRWNDQPSLKERLQAMDKDEGIHAEIERVGRMVAATYSDWGRSDPDVLVIRYEDLIGPSRHDAYDRIFRHWQFHGPAHDFAVNTMAGFEFERRTGRQIGSTGTGVHLRSGKSGGWQAELNDSHKDAIKAHFGQELIRFGYETDLDW